MSASLAGIAPSSAPAAVANLSPLHLQLLLMMGSCHNVPNMMEEAKNVQRILHIIEPEGAANAANEANTQAPAAATATKKKGAPKPAGVDHSADWDAEAIQKLVTSNTGIDMLQLAMLHDPANPWHLTLRDADKSLKYYGLAAIKMPSAYACARLAHFWITGEFTGGKDVAKSAKWLRMGAMKGHALCQYQLGFMLEDGTTGVKDVKQAIEWYRKAADSKYPAAMFNLASLLIEPDDTYDGVEQDIYTAIRLMEDAAALGDVSSQLKLGHLCFMGSTELDIEASVPRTIQYLTMAAHNENEPSVDAAKILGIIYSTSETNSYENEYYDLERSIKYLGIAAASGHADSRILLQRQQAKLAKVQKGMVIDHASEHLKAMRILAGQEGQPIANSEHTKSASDAAFDAVNTALLTSTPSEESLYLALARLHARYPEYGSSRLHSAVKQEYPHWQVSEKRVKLLMKKHEWSAEGGAGPAAGADGAVLAKPTTSTSAPIPAIVLDSGAKQRLNDRVIVNDLD